MLEDAILHPALPCVMWLAMTASHQYLPSSFHINTLLSIVWEIASIDISDPLPAGLFEFLKTEIF
jgi:hypothetical protein